MIRCQCVISVDVISCRITCELCNRVELQRQEKYYASIKHSPDQQHDVRCPRSR